MIVMEPQDEMKPPVGWAQTAKVPPGWQDPDHRPGYGLKVTALMFLIFGSFFSVFGNWVVSEPAYDNPGVLARTSEGDVLLGIASSLLFIGVTLMVAALVVGYRSRRTN